MAERSLATVKEIIDEGLRSPERFSVRPDAERALWKRAADAAVATVRKNIPLYPPGSYPAPASQSQRYRAVPNVEWTSSFWSGMLWLSFELSGSKEFKDAALAQIPDFRRRLDERIALDTHDLGFLYSLSCVAAHKLTGDRAGRDAALLAAALLMGRYYEKAGIIQAWGDLNDPSQRGRIIIDCLMNLPLLFWASEKTGDARYREAAGRHVEASAANLLRDDASSFHTFFFDVESGAPLRGRTAQGRSDDSCWARGQAWGIYGLALCHRSLGKPWMLESASRLAHYFLNRLPADCVCYWDLSITGGNAERDSSAAAIAACGLIELAAQLPVADPRRRDFENAAASIARSLATDYAPKEEDGSNGLLLHAVYNKPKNEGVDECCVWGDYFYLELLSRFLLSWKPYW
jgi:unsaturated chondroitin disaccharide hydrolase